jgi:hypothetical protein
LTYSYTFTWSGVGNSCNSYSGSIALTWDGVSRWNGTLPGSPVCAPCGGNNPSCGGTQNDEPVALVCGGSGPGATLQLAWPNYGTNCVWQLNGPSPNGTFTCSPFHWTMTASDFATAACVPRLCGYGCMQLSGQTISA